MSKRNFIIKLALGLLVVMLMNAGLIAAIIAMIVVKNEAVDTGCGMAITGIIAGDVALLGYLFGPKKHHNEDEDENKDEDKKEDIIVDNQDKKE